MALAAVIGLYSIFLAVGWLAARRVKDGTAADLIVAGRAMPLWLATLTMTATWVDGGYLLGTAEGAFKSSVASGAQGGLCFGVSLILGGIFFARRMRRFKFTTLIDPFEARFGKRWAAVLFLPALLGEVFWSAELLVAVGSTFGVSLGMKLTTAILLSALVVTCYTMLGGMWSVAYTDALQLGLVALGLVAALPLVLNQVGGLEAAWAGYAAARPERAGLLPPLEANSFWTTQTIVNWWDVSLMLALGGIPWNCYFQRVLSCRTPARAAWHSILAGLLTICFVAPPLLMGVAAFGYPWPPDLLAELQAQPAETLPMLFRHLAPPLVALLGLGAIIGAVTSSFSASVLSAASMFAWNCCHRLLRPDLSAAQMRRLIRFSIAALGAVAAALALKVQSVQALWFFTSDLIFVLLFPQLVFALFDPKANRAGSITAFCVSLVLRLGGGEPLFNLPPLIPYPEIFSVFLPGGPQSWYDAGTGALLFPFKTLAAAVGIVCLPVVSRLTSRWDAPQPLRNVGADERDGEASGNLKFQI
jgi:solute carrier family 5 (high affinity choline transporter), member 7